MDLEFLKNLEYLVTIIVGITVLFILTKTSNQKF